MEVVDWDVEQIHASATTARIYRLSGTARDRREATPWSLILKIVGLEPDNNDPSGWAYWKREILAYQSGLLDDLPGDLVAPRCFGTVEQADEAHWLWLEEVQDELGPLWPLDHYGVVARHFGRFNGAYLVGRPMSTQPWLSVGWLRQYVSGRTPGTTFAPRRAYATNLGPDSLAHPLLRDVLPARTAEGICQLWEERDTFLDALDRLPHTFCHLDAFRRNLFARRGADGGDETVVIDWTDAGTGAIGEEIVPLVVATVVCGDVPWAQAAELERLVFEGYLAGLRDAGWHGDPRQVRFGYTAASALHYSFVGLQTLLSLAFDEVARAQWEQGFGVPARDMMVQVAQEQRFLLCLADEARQLLEEL